MHSPIILFAVIIVSTNAMACKCVVPGQTIEESVQNSDFIFVGKCVAGELLEEGSILSPEKYNYKVLWTLEIQEKLKGQYSSDTIKIETGIGTGDCGFPFVFGFSFLVYGKVVNGNIETSICSRTKMAGVYPIRFDDNVKNEIDTVANLLMK